MKLKYLHFHYLLLLFLIAAFTRTANAQGLPCGFLNIAPTNTNLYLPRTTPQSINVGNGDYIKFDVKNGANYIWDVCGFYDFMNGYGYDAQLSGFQSTNTTIYNWANDDYAPCDFDASSQYIGINGWSSTFSGIEYVQISGTGCPPAGSFPDMAPLHYRCIPPTFPNISDPGINVWNVYCYDAGDASGNGGAWGNNYSGYYTDSALSFNTNTRWSNTPYDANAIGGKAYAGCYITAANQSWRAIRTNIPCGIYQIQATFNGDGKILINGSEIINGSTRVIGFSDIVEFKVSNAGPAMGNITFNNVPPASVLSGGSIGYNGLLKVCGEPYAPPAFLSNSVASGGNSSTAPNGSSKYRWQLNGGDINTAAATGLTFSPPNLFVGTYVYRRKVIDKCNDSAFSNAITISVNLPTNDDTDFITICASQLPYAWKGHTVNAAGTAAAIDTVLSLVTGCDSITTLNLTVIPLKFTTETITICADALPYAWNGHVVHTGGPTAAVDTTLSLITGCDSITTLNLIVNANPHTSFSINDTNQCLNLNSYSFNSTSGVTSGSINTYTWSFGDGGTIAGTTAPTHAYTDTGTYTIKLVTVSNKGCMDSVTQDAKVSPKPVPAFSINIANQCLNPNSYTFNNTSSVSNNSLLTYAWSFDDGGTSTAANPSGHIYSASGNYMVKLIVTSADGCIDSITHNAIVYPKPTAAFTINTANQCVNPNSYSFTNGSGISAGTITYKWDFGDGGTSTAANPSGYVYTAAGTYHVKLIVTSDHGCKDSIVHDVVVYPKPVVNFSINTANQCINPNSYTFTNVTTGATGYSWDFGDGTTSTTSNPSGKIYAAPGTYHVKLVATSGNGCMDSITKDVTIYPKPVAGFNINITNQCVNPNSYTFTNTSTGATTYAWSFGDGNTSNQTSPSGYSYAASNTYPVKVVATSGDGCKDSITQNVTVYPKPVANFSINTANQCVNPNSYTFTSIGTGANTYDWDWGDGTTATGATPAAKVYTTSGTYFVKLVVTSGNGCKDSITKQVIVYPKPVAAFSINTADQCINVNNYTFTNSSTGAATYEWNLGNGNYTTVPSPTNYSYISAGTFHVTLVAISSNGCKDSVSHDVTIYPKPTASFTINTPNQCVNPNSYTFASTSTSGVSYAWDYGDGTNATGATPAAKVYALAGTYDVKLVVTSVNGCKDSILRQVIVYPKPTASFSINFTNQCLNPNNYIFTNTSSGGATYQWYFGDGGSSTATSSTGYIYTTAGIYQVKLIVTSGNGCKDSVTNPVTVYPKPVPSFTINNTTQCLAGNSYSFTNTTAGAVSYVWDFGDGTATSTAISPSGHIYTTAGTYHVKLIATSTNGCKDSIVNDVTVYSQPVVNFTINAANQCVNPNSYTFTNTTTGAVSYVWDFGDGTPTSTTTSPAGHVYAAAGTYHVKLVATSGNSCKDSITKDVIIYPKPTAAFTINIANQCVNPNSYTFTSTSTGGATYAWDYGDNTFGSGASPAAKTYTASGPYTVKLIVTSSNGCKDSTTNGVTVYPKPMPSFTVNNMAQCLSGNSFVFTNTSTIGSGSMNYTWDFGDGTNYAGQTPPAHTYASNGGYIVKLIATSNNGCKDSITQEVTVSPKPSPSFTINQAGQCLVNNSFTFTNTSTIPSGTMTYFWNFGDGTDYTGSPAPAHTYTLPGTYHVKLIAFSSTGCKDSITQDVTIYPKPAPSFTMNAPNICVSPTYNFNNTSTITGVGSMTYEWYFGDGGTFNGQTPPAHTYAATGNYTIKLIATSNNGCKDSATTTITIDPKPAASFTINNTAQCLDGNSYTFTNTSNIGATMSYRWDYGDGNIYNGTSAPAHIYTAAGIYHIKLVATGNNGCKDSITHDVTVYPEPVPAFTMNAPNICQSPTYVFTNTSAISSGTMTYDWNLGDGNNYTGQTPPAHTYAPGTYTITLDVTSNNGCKKSTTQTITILAAPIASFTINANEQCVNDNNYVFTNTSVVGGGLVTYLWNFGDGNTSTADAPTHVYTTAGTYTITLIATNSIGCSDTASEQISVYTAPTATMTGDNTICLGESATISIALTGTPPWELSYTDGAIPQTVTNVIASPYTFTVSPSSERSYHVESLFDAYCAAGTGDIHGGATILVAHKPTISIDRSDSILCQGDELQLVAHGSDSAYRWSTGDETCCISVGDASLYRVTVSNQCGDAADSIRVVYGNCEKCIWVPSGFTPNKDGKNDVFRGVSYCKVLKYSIKVFNRYGNVVYESSDPKAGWDGTTDGNDNPIATYFYVIKATFFVSGVERDVKLKGDVTLIR